MLAELSDRSLFLFLSHLDRLNLNRFKVYLVLSICKGVFFYIHLAILEILSRV
jgi:hypothetical protein